MTLPPWLAVPVIPRFTAVLCKNHLPPKSLPPKNEIPHTAKKIPPCIAIPPKKYHHNDRLSPNQCRQISIQPTKYRQLSIPPRKYCRLSIPPRTYRPLWTPPKTYQRHWIPPKGTACTEYDRVFFYKVTFNVRLSVFICVLLLFWFCGFFFFYTVAATV